MDMFFAVLLTGLMLAVLYLDFTRFTIPNKLVLAVTGLWLAFLALHWGNVDWVMALALAAGAFVLGFVIFLLRVMGGGDVKLLAACMLWVGQKECLTFLFAIGILGGALAVLLLIGRPVVPWIYSRFSNPPPIPRVFTIGEPVPYGLAIAGAFLGLLWMGYLPGLTINFTEY